MSPVQRLRHALALIALLAMPGLSRADSYQYDELGNVQTLSTPRGVRGYTYDEVQRLDTESGYTGTRDHAYDRNGNRTSDGASVPTPVTFSAGSNRVATINGVSIVIDAAGQIASDGTNQLTWDDAGRLKTVSRSGTLYATYYYDHRQRRTRKVTTAAAPQGARTIVYHYDEADRLIAETSETGVPLRSYLWADDTLLAQVEYQFNATSGLYTVLRELIFELDHLGTPRQARLTDGTVVWRWESDGYGNTAPNQDPDGNGQATYVYLRFPGQYDDEESGLHYNGHRYYAPRLGRYLSSDPIGINGGSNTYAYVEGNPLSGVDPEGLAGIFKNWGQGKPIGPLPDPAGEMKNKNDSNENLPTGVNGIRCALGLGGCPTDDPALYRCVMARCTPKCGDPFIIDYRANGMHMFDPTTTRCECILNGFNPNYKGGPPPGL